MRVIAWILLIFCSFETLKALGGMFFEDDAEQRFLSLFMAIVQAASVYVALTYLYFAHTPFRWAIIAVSAFNGISALLSLFKEEAIERIFAFAVKTFYCIGFILML